MRVAVAYSPAEREIDLTDVDVPEGSTLAAALSASGLLNRHPMLMPTALQVGIWGRSCSIDAPLAEGDRVEVYRALQRDPKQSRRLRGQRQKRVRKPR